VSALNLEFYKAFYANFQYLRSNLQSVGLRFAPPVYGSRCEQSATDLKGARNIQVCASSTTATVDTTSVRHADSGIQAELATLVSSSGADTMYGSPLYNTLADCEAAVTHEELQLGHRISSSRDFV